MHTDSAQLLTLGVKIVSIQRGCVQSAPSRESGGMLPQEFFVFFSMAACKVRHLGGSGVMLPQEIVVFLD